MSPERWAVMHPGPPRPTGRSERACTASRERYDWLGLPAGCAEEELINEFSQIGYAALAGLVLGESVGIPVPGSTALLAAGVLASDHKLNVTVVCLLGVVLTVIGAAIAFTIGGRIGSQALVRPGPFLRHREAIVRKGMPIVVRFGWLAAFASRFVPGLKECGSLLLGALGMTWREYLFWSIPGGVAWVLSHALLGYYLGRALGVSGSVVAIAGIELTAVALAVTVRYVRAQRLRSVPVAKPED